MKELVTAHPSLAKASWDWGFGDWETALGSASDVGNRPIAEFLQFLTTLGTPFPAVPVVPLSDAEPSALEGRYVFGPGKRDAFSVRSQGNLWGIQRDGGDLRGLTRRSPDETDARRADSVPRHTITFPKIR